MSASAVLWLLICCLIASLSLCSLFGGKFRYDDDGNEGDPK